MDNRWKLIAGLALLLLLAANAYLLWQAGNREVVTGAPAVNIGADGKASTGQEPRVVYVEGQNTHTREIVYVPKEQGEPTDVEVTRKGSFVYVQVNGKLHQIPVEVKEDTKFEKGKLVITEQSEVRVNITAPKQYMSLGLGMSTNGLAAQGSGPLAGNVGWWLYGDRKTVAAGLTVPLLR